LVHVQSRDVVGSQVRRIRSTRKKSMILCFASIAYAQIVRTQQQPAVSSRMVFRPAGASFATPYEDLLIRTWTPADRDQAACLIEEVLVEYGIGWDPKGTDADAIKVEKSYESERAEFWVVESCKDNKIVGTAAFRPAARSPKDTAELRKMYIAKEVRDRGLGRFLLHALEDRARQIGYSKSFVETASVLVQAVDLYNREGYEPVSGLETARCDLALAKWLGDRRGTCHKVSTQPTIVSDEEFVLIADEAGYVVTETLRLKAQKRRLLYKGIVVLVLTEDGKQAFVHRRSKWKVNFPGTLDLFIAGAVHGSETLLEAAYRELGEELGLDGENFEWTSLWDGMHIVDRGEGDRCCFEGFVAKSKGVVSDADIRFTDGEVEDGRFMSRLEIDQSDIRNPVWTFVQSLEKNGSLPGRCKVF
jgi:putative acetyltransferase